MISPGIAAPNSALLLPPPSLSIRVDEFEAWLNTAEPGARIEYHRGALGIDRERASSPFPEKRRRELQAFADRVGVLAGQGRLFLIQERHGENDFSYIAVMATPARRLKRAI